MKIDFLPQCVELFLRLGRLQSATFEVVRGHRVRQRLSYK